jgi:magnesium transporter
MQIKLLDSQGIQDKQVADLPALFAAEGDAVFWVDMTGPSDEDVRLMREMFHFHPVAIEDTRNHHQRPKIEEYPGYLFLIVNPVSAHEADLEFRELDIFVGRNYVVTVHGADELIIAEAQKRLSHASTLPQISVSYVMYVLLDIVVDGYFPVMDRVEEEINDLEDVILTRPRQESLTHVFTLKRTLLRLWRVVWPERDILSTLAQPHILGFADKSAAQYYLRDVADHLFWIADMVGTFRDTLTSIIDLYMSAVSNRLNRTVNRLTVITLAFGLSAVITGFYGMNFNQTWPAFSDPMGVPFVLILIALVAGIMLIILRRIDNF